MCAIDVALYFTGPEETDVELALQSDRQNKSYWLSTNKLPINAIQVQSHPYSTTKTCWVSEMKLYLNSDLLKNVNKYMCLGALSYNYLKLSEDIGSVYGKCVNKLSLISKTRCLSDKRTTLILYQPCILAILYFETV